jgi:hypothetical protein
MMTTSVTIMRLIPAVRGQLRPRLPKGRDWRGDALILIKSSFEQDCLSISRDDLELRFS